MLLFGLKCLQFYLSESLLNRCVPSQLGEGAGSVLSGSGIQELGQELVQDFQVSQKELAYMGLIALGQIISFIVRNISTSSLQVSLY